MADWKDPEIESVDTLVGTGALPRVGEPAASAAAVEQPDFPLPIITDAELCTILEDPQILAFVDRLLAVDQAEVPPVVAAVVPPVAAVVVPPVAVAAVDQAEVPPVVAAVVPPVAAVVVPPVAVADADHPDVPPAAVVRPVAVFEAVQRTRSLSQILRELDAAGLYPVRKWRSLSDFYP